MTFIFSIALFLLPVFSHAADNRCDERCLKERALSGDGKAAMQLADRLLYSDREKMKWWYSIAAENGNIDDQYSYAHFLALEGKTEEECLRAIYWFDQAAKKGHQLSVKRRNALRMGIKAGDDYTVGCSKRYTEGT